MKQVWGPLTGDHEHRFCNLDGIFLEGLLAYGELIPTKIVEFIHNNSISSIDHCTVKSDHQFVMKKLRLYNRSMNKKEQKETRKASRVRKGGGFPLAYYNNGVQLRGLTSSHPSGVGLEHSNNTWVRTPLEQHGGFSPSVMSTFARTGMKLLPAAAFMGHRMIKHRTIKKRRNKNKRNY